jgi:hypothetical protein
VLLHQFSSPDCPFLDSLHMDTHPCCIWIDSPAFGLRAC